MPSHESLPQESIDFSQTTASDAQAIADVFIKSRADMTYIDSTIHTAEETKTWLESVIADEDNTVIKLSCETNIVGFCVVKEDWLEHVYIHPDYQGYGIGTTLIRAAQALYPTLNLWVFQQNIGAIKLYEKEGFILVEQTNGQRNEEKVPDARYIWKRS